jgi:hypothetical protein
MISNFLAEASVPILERRPKDINKGRRKMFKLKFREGSDVIFTTYFSSKENPQAGQSSSVIFAPKNKMSYIFSWYSSVRYHKLNAVVIHDGLSPEFIQEYENDHVQFIFYKPEKYSLNDARFFALNHILTENRLGKVLLTDGSDIIIKGNPFNFISNPNLLYFGSDEPKLPRIRDNAWCVQKLTMLSEHSCIELTEDVLDFEYINAGVYGGYYDNLRAFNESLTILFDQLNSNANNNMMAINYLLWKFKLQHFKGQPFTSPFKRFELHGDYVIVHK